MFMDSESSDDDKNDNSELLEDIDIEGDLEEQMAKIKEARED